MRPRRKRSNKPWHFDDYDESDYYLESSSDWSSGSSNRAVVTQGSNRNQSVNLALCPKNAGLQIKISGDISICVVGENGKRREIFRLVCLEMITCQGGFKFSFFFVILTFYLLLCGFVF